MASSKEILQTPRPLTHRPSMPSNSLTGGGGLSLTRQSHSRNTSHSVIGAALNGSHRVTRRKSMTNTGANVAAISAALQQEAGDRPMPLPINVNARRNTISRNGLSRSGIAGSLPSPPGSLPSSKFVSMNMTANLQDSAIDDEMNDGSGDERAQKARVRRASDGQPLIKEGRKSNRPELRCEQCGKGYKHSSCLTKHLWEHTPEWSFTSKLLISKHQQVQLLEAASVLMAINNNPSTTPPDSARDFPSDQDSASPGPSGFSEHPDASSADTTPPPQLDGVSVNNPMYATFAKRSSIGSAISRSYQSAAYASSTAGSIPNSAGFGHFRNFSHDNRPVSSGRNTTGQDDHELATALGGCNFGSYSSLRGVHQLPADAPPVPPLPAQYLDKSVSGADLMGSFRSGPPESFTRGAPESFTRGAPQSFARSTRVTDRDDVKMDESGESVQDDDDDDDTGSRARSDEDDDGVFGRMEE